LKRDDRNRRIRIKMVQNEPDRLDTHAQKMFGITYLFPYQRLVVSNIIEGKSQIVILPTGAGKSLCFTLPSQLLPGVTLVVFPLLSLMSDQARRLEEQGIPVGILRGGQKKTERENVWSECTSGRIKIVLTNPETAMTESVKNHLKSLVVSHLVIDEAHTVSEWGESFRPAYLAIKDLQAEISVPLLTAFTATASSVILEKLRNLLFPVDMPHLVRAVPDRPNIRYSVIPALSKDHELRMLALRSELPMIVFCRSRAGAELTSRMLRHTTNQSEVYFYHAGLEKDEKKTVENWFFNSQDGILCATCAYGMGVDKANIRTVIHRDIPSSVEAYLQESGRAGRDRDRSEAIVLYSREDFEILDAIQDEIAKERFQAMLEYLNCVGRCRREYLLELLNAEAEACFGCDVCDGNVIAAPAGLRQIVKCISIHKRRFNRREIRQLIAGTNHMESIAKKLYTFKGHGILRGWTESEIEEAVQSLIITGALKERKRSPWKYRLTVPHA
jgi:ATP-dependent DNA helicase RecQ